MTMVRCSLQSLAIIGEQLSSQCLKCLIKIKNQYLLSLKS